MAAVKAYLIVLFSLACGWGLVTLLLKREIVQPLRTRVPLFLFVMVTALFFSPHLFVVYALCLAAPLIFARDRDTIILLYFCGPFAIPALQGTIRAGGAYITTVSTAICLGLGALAAYAIRPAEERPARGIPPATLAAVALATLVFMLAFSRGQNVTSTMRTVVDQLLIFVLPVAIALMAVRGRGGLRAVMIALAIGSVLMSTQGLIESVMRWPVYQESYRRYAGSLDSAVWVSYQIRGGLLRATGPWQESTAFGFLMGVCALAVLFNRRLFRTDLHHIGASLFVVAGLVAPNSRNAFLGLVVGITLATLYRAPKKAALAVGGLGLSGLAVLVMARISPRVAEMTGLGQGAASDTADYRRQLWDRGREEFWVSPWTGDSFPNVIHRLRDLTQGQGIVDFVNGYLYIALLTGFVGLAAFVLLILLPLGQLLATRRRMIAADDIASAAFCFGALATIAIQLFFTAFGGISQLLVMFLVGIAAAMTRLPLPARPSGTADPVDASQGVDRGAATVAATVPGLPGLSHGAALPGLSWGGTLPGLSRATGGSDRPADAPSHGLPALPQL